MASGFLALVATPIGNLEDITYRAVRVLGEADLIAAEDTRRARQLLKRYEIDRPLTTYHAHNEHRKTAELLQRVLDGTNLAMLSDAGTPCISDPGYLLVRDAVACGIEPMIIPGVSALTYAATASGLPVSDLHFAGFLPRKPGKRRSRISSLAAGSQTFVLFESPFRMSKLLAELAEVLGGTTQVAVVREATKQFEECLRGSAAELADAYAAHAWRGELTVVVHAQHAEEEVTP